LEGDGSTEINGVATLEAASEGDLSFLANLKYYNAARQTKASAILVDRECLQMSTALLRHDNPYLAFARAIELFYTPYTVQPFIHRLACIADSAVLGNGVYVGPYVYIGDRVVVGNGSIVHARCTIHDDAQIGDGTLIHSGTVVRERVIIGKNCIIQNNAVVGSDGFGYARQSNGEWYRILQTGTVIIEDDVDIGAGVTIDRPTLGDTRIMRGTKIDNQVHIGHGCLVGPNNLLCAQVGLAGSTKTGTNVVLTGQVGVVGHLTIGDGTIVTPQSGVANSVEAGRTISGSPAIDHNIWLRSSAAFSRLADTQRAVRSLESRVSILEDLDKEKLDPS
jgi:UDP-3-O-[3-hydroxymyristoyl] glucosamine N-acyltransferase